MCSDYKVNPTSSSDWLISLPLSIYLKDKLMHQQFGKSLTYSYLMSTVQVLKITLIQSSMNVFTYIISANVFSSSHLQ